MDSCGHARGLWVRAGSSRRGLAPRRLSDEPRDALQLGEYRLLRRLQLLDLLPVRLERLAIPVGGEGGMARRGEGGGGWPVWASHLRLSEFKSDALGGVGAGASGAEEEEDARP